MSTQTQQVASMAKQDHAWKIAIQGYSGAFHELAARLFFGKQTIEIVPNDTFSELVAQVESGEVADFGLMAIENTIAGSLMNNYKLLKDSDLQIIGEIHLRIQQNLMVWPGQKIEDLEEVHSHPVAIVQCREFFKKYPHIRLVENVDTALSARNIQENQDKKKGAIASSLAAEIYGLETIAHGIETNKRNFTRFLLLKNTKTNHLPSEQDKKVSICFSVEHEVGGLHKILAVMSAYGANLTKIQSAPIIGKEWEYMFFVDFLAEGKHQHEQILKVIEPLTVDMNLLGVYPKGEHFEQ